MPSLLRAADVMDAHFAAHPIPSYDQLHSMNANLEALGMLGQALPDRYDWTIPWVFDWSRKW